ncbi:PIN domain-containing protein [Geobacter hydrogenophilus]|uniref:PIN domain-containing protein n=1 Tax=Geobacter hydrogenophilus TaxID=40983 RepID=A0A9W6G2A0_9BACT|nr:PIN domain-containing protein [Geobacter hydrogenophilus]MBT0893017.1 PIN domain-containing protein [Geobacter hydrogenophilus]GLI39146.1 PIN domain-containing protein [Geobacter hydrogenophilus]
MKVLIDTNVVLDIALNRKPFVEHATLLWRLAEQKVITGCLSNTSITDIFYIINKHAGPDKARDFITDLLDTFRLADIDENGFREALHSGMNDFEDAVQYVICERNGCDALVTRNKADYVGKPNVLDPDELIERIKSEGI